MCAQRSGQEGPRGCNDPLIYANHIIESLENRQRYKWVVILTVSCPDDAGSSLLYSSANASTSVRSKCCEKLVGEFGVGLQGNEPLPGQREASILWVQVVSKDPSKSQHMSQHIIGCLSQVLSDTELSATVTFLIQPLARSTDICLHQLVCNLDDESQTLPQSVAAT